MHVNCSLADRPGSSLFGHLGFLGIINNRCPHTSLCGEEGLPAVGGVRVYSSLCATMEVQSCFIRQQLSAYFRASACALQLCGRGGSCWCFFCRMVSSNGRTTMDRWRQEPRLHDCLGVDDSGSLSLSPNVILQLRLRIVSTNGVSLALSLVLTCSFSLARSAVCSAGAKAGSCSSLSFRDGLPPGNDADAGASRHSITCSFVQH